MEETQQKSDESASNGRSDRRRKEGWGARKDEGGQGKGGAREGNELSSGSLRCQQRTLLATSRGKNDDGIT